MIARNLVVLVIVPLLLLAGCRNQPIVNVESAPLKASPAVTLEAVGQLIKQESTVRGWKVTEKQPGVMVGDLVVRGKHEAKIEIYYDTKEFSINYLSSNNLNYQIRDGEPRIHPSYNKWVRYLRDSIQDKAKGL